MSVCVVDDTLLKNIDKVKDITLILLKVVLVH